MIDAAACSLGIIGGADGPTAIFVAGTLGGWLFPGLILTAAVAAAFVFVKKKK